MFHPWTLFEVASNRENLTFRICSRNKSSFCIQRASCVNEFFVDSKAYRFATNGLRSKLHYRLSVRVWCLIDLEVQQDDIFRWESCGWRWIVGLYYSAPLRLGDSKSILLYAEVISNCLFLFKHFNINLLWVLWCKLPLLFDISKVNAWNSWLKKLIISLHHLIGPLHKIKLLCMRDPGRWFLYFNSFSRLYIFEHRDFCFWLWVACVVHHSWQPLPELLWEYTALLKNTALRTLCALSFILYHFTWRMVKFWIWNTFCFVVRVFYSPQTWFRNWISTFIGNRIYTRINLRYILHLKYLWGDAGL